MIPPFPTIDLHSVYTFLREQFGPQEWWPAETPFEVIIGAILTQNTAWKNVEKAVCALARKNLLKPKTLDAVPLDTLAATIRSSGCYNQKAMTIKAFLKYFKTYYDYDLESMSHGTLEVLRRELLAIRGIGGETADCILLYALNKPTFVVDAYTKRILSRLGLVQTSIPRARLKTLLERAIPRDPAVYGEFHALFVTLGKVTCRKKPLCSQCPLKLSCEYYHENTRPGLDGQSDLSSLP